MLVYEPGQAAPLYRIGPFVVVHSGIARLVVEVKSDLDQKCFKQVLDVYDDIPNANVPALGYGFDGVTMAKFIEYLQAAAVENRRKLAPWQAFLNWPICFAVHEKNYFCIRPTTCLAQPAAYWCCCVNFAVLGEGGEAAATAQFFNTYYRLLAGEQVEDTQLRRWFNEVEVPPQGKAWITPDGVVHHGEIP